MESGELLTFPALRLRQGANYVYLFALDGTEVHKVASISRVRRDSGLLSGYQRPEVRNHIRAIRRYLESSEAILPNALVVAFDSRVEFRGSVQTSTDSQVGEIVIRLGSDPGVPPGWIVDGQQRAAALRDADLSGFAVPIVAFISDSEEEQRAQFILVNSTKPLPRGLIHELLPDTTAPLPPTYARKQLPAAVMIRLNSNPGGVFAGKIQMPTESEGYIKDNSIIRMIENSLYEGALYQYRDPQSGRGDVDAMVLHLEGFWSVVARVFGDAWKLPPRKSRLTHGVGIQSMGFVMDALTEGSTWSDLRSDHLEDALTKLMSITAWTSGTWPIPGDSRRWNGLQNTPNDVKLLTNFLIRELQQI